jgi:hypothetical protein
MFMLYKYINGEQVRFNEVMLAYLNVPSDSRLERQKNH